MPSPKYKIYRGEEFIGATVHAQDAAVMVGCQSSGTVRVGGKILYRQGNDGDAGESFDAAANLILQREAEGQRKAYIKQYGQAAYDQAIERIREERRSR